MVVVCLSAVDTNAVVSVGDGPQELCEMSPVSRRSVTCCSLVSVSTASGNESESEDGSSTAPESPRCARGRILQLARDPSGTRQVQALLEMASSESERCAIAAELEGHIVKAARCPNANHVLQKCIVTMEPASLQFIIDELLASRAALVQLAKHRYAGRVLQHLLVKCEPQRVAEITDCLLENAETLACHSFGCHAILRVMQHGDRTQQYRLLRTLERHAGSVARCHSGCLVVAAALDCVEESEKVWLARAFAQYATLLFALCDVRQGHVLVLPLLQALPAAERARAEACLAWQLRHQGPAKYGGIVSKQLQEVSQQRC
jgi:hypothetical protein